MKLLEQNQREISLNNLIFELRNEIQDQNTKLIISPKYYQIKLHCYKDQRTHRPTFNFHRFSAESET